MAYPHIIIGTRGSDLALKQTEIVRGLLRAVDGSLSIEAKIIKTESDRNSAPIPLDQIGKGWFTKEIEAQLQSGEIDLAVHSLKDLPETLGEGLVIGAITERGDWRDALVSKSGKRLMELPAGAIIGTDSPRRKVQLLALRPDIIVKSIRGNVPNRLQKLRDEGYDALVLAAAGLERIDANGEITEYFELERMVPAPGQGALAVEMKAVPSTATAHILSDLLKRINHLPTSLAAEAERAFSKAVGGGCKSPVGAYASSKGEEVTLTGMISTGEGKIVRGTLRGAAGENIGEKLAEQLREKTPH